MNLYGTNWKTESQIDVELYMIKRGGYWRDKKGARHGGGLLHHWMTLQSLIAPWKVWDRWSKLILGRIIRNKMTILTGPASSTKTHNMAFYGVCKYLLNPENQCVLVSSTDARSLELKIWGEIKKIWSQACSAYSNTPGRIVESRQMIVTDVADTEATDYRNGIIAIPCVVGGSFVGLGKYAGIKNGNVLLLADELSYMSPAFYDAISNLRKNPGFQCIGSGNPKDRTDVLGKLAEPAIELGGWEGYEPNGKTTVYKTRFLNGEAIILDGRDSPNNDGPANEPPKFPYIIQQSDIAADVEYYGEDSVQVNMFDYGIFPRDAQAKRVITRSLCEKFLCFEPVVWGHESIIKLFGMGAAYGAVGGDRCVGLELHLGICTDGKQRLAFAGNPMIIPVTNRSDLLPEDQIATWVMDYCQARQIPPNQVAFDATGRGTLMAAFGRVWSPMVVAIEFGGLPSDRMVSTKLQVPCKKYYFNFATELWYQSRTLMESDQLRNLPVAVMEEGCMRAWSHVAGNKIKIEPKEDCKLRMSRSPDLYDSFVTGVELAIKLGLKISGTTQSTNADSQWFKDLAEKQKQLRRRYQLNYS